MGTLIKEVKIEISGKPYKNYNFLNITLTQELLRPNQLHFTMQKKKLDQSIEDKDSAFPLPKELMGAKVELTIKAMRYDSEKEKLIIFKGIIANVDIHRRSDMFTEQLFDITAFSSDFLLMDHPHCYSYENETLKNIISTTLKPYSIPNEINPRTTGAILYTVQYNETNYQFLTRLALRFGEWMYNDGSSWYFGKKKVKDTVKLDPRHDILDYRFQVGLMHHKLKHAHHDYLKYDNLIKSDSDFSNLTQSGYHELTDEAKNKSATWLTKETFQHLQCSNPEDNDIDELEVSAKALLFGEKTSQVVCMGSSVSADLTIGSVIQIGDYFYETEKEKEEKKHKDLIITRIVHSTEIDGHYSNSFTAYPASSEYPPYYQSDIFPISSAQRAVVMENNDPEKLGRIRVQFLWQEKQNPNLITPWIRIAQPHGGDDKGFYFIPEIDEEVMVDFENGNAEKPYIVGTLWHGKQIPGNKWPTGSNDIKAIRTRNGHTVEIHDEGSDGYIRIYDHKKENYILTFSTDDKLIKLESTGNIELYAEKDIIMKAKNNINMKADKEIKEEAGSNMTLEAGSDVSIKAGSNMSLKANQNISLDSTMHEQKASASMKLDGGGQLEAKAGIVKIN